MAGGGGLDVSTEEYRAHLGYLPQDFGYYPDFSGMKFLLYMAALKGLDKSYAKKRALELLDLVGIQEKNQNLFRGDEAAVRDCPGALSGAEAFDPG